MHSHAEVFSHAEARSLSERAERVFSSHRGDRGTEVFSRGSLSSFHAEARSIYRESRERDFSSHRGREETE